MAACDVELASAIPLIREAEAAVDCLNVNAVNELKSFSTLASGLELVVKALLML